MYITITKQHQGENFKGSVRDFVNYLEKENEGKDRGGQELFFDQYQEDIPPEVVIMEIDGNTKKLSKTEPRFYSLVVSPSQRELGVLGNDSKKLRDYVRELMKDYAAAFNRNTSVNIDDIKFYAKLEQERYYKGTDREIRENQPYATQILALKNELRTMERGATPGNPKRIQKEIDRLEREAPHKVNGKRILRGMPKPGPQQHVHIITSHKDATNSFKLSPLAQKKKGETILNGKNVKQGFDRDAFFKASEKTFDRMFNHQRQFMERYGTRNLLDKDPKRFFAMLLELPTTERQAALKVLFKAGVKVPNIPVNQTQLAYKTLMRIKRGVQKAIDSGTIGI